MPAAAYLSGFHRQAPAEADKLRQTRTRIGAHSAEALTSEQSAKGTQPKQGANEPCLPPTEHTAAIGQQQSPAAQNSQLSVPHLPLSSAHCCPLFLFLFCQPSTFSPNSPPFSATLFVAPQTHTRHWLNMHSKSCFSFSFFSLSLHLSSYLFAPLPAQLCLLASCRLASPNPPPSGELNFAPIKPKISSLRYQLLLLSVRRSSLLFIVRQTVCAPRITVSPPRVPQLLQTSPTGKQAKPSQSNTRNAPNCWPSATSGSFVAPCGARGACGVCFFGQRKRGRERELETGAKS